MNVTVEITGAELKALLAMTRREDGRGLLQIDAGGRIGEFPPWSATAHRQAPPTKVERGFRGVSTPPSTLPVPLPRLWRHRYSGLWIGYIVGRSELLQDHLVFVGRRIWSWSGGRLECSQVAAQGCRAGDRLGEWVTAEIAIEGSIEILPTTETIIEAARALPADGGQ